MLATYWECRYYLLPQWRHVLVYLVSTGAILLMGIASGLLSADLLTNKIFLAQPLSEFQAQILGLDQSTYVNVDELSESSRLTLRIYFLLTFGFLLGVTFFLGLGLSYYLTWILQRVNQHLREVMMDNALRLSLNYHQKSQVGDAIYRIFQDSAMVTAVIQTSLIQPLILIGTYFTVLAVLFFFSPYLASLFVLATVPSCLCMYFITSVLRSRSVASREASSSLTSHIQESIQNAKLLKSLAIETDAYDQFNTRSQIALDRAYELRRTLVLLNLAVYFFTAFVTLFSDYLMVHWIWDGQETFGYGVVAFIGFAVWDLGAYRAAKEQSAGVSNSLVGLATTWSWIQDMGVGLKRAFLLLDVPPEVQEQPNAKEVINDPVSVAFEDVSFTYRDDQPLLHHIDFNSLPGTVTAILGPSGVGKSTLMSLLLRLYDTNDGLVRLGGDDIRMLKLQSLRDSISIVLQENALFPLSIRENILYATKAVDDTLLQTALYVSCLDELIKELPDGIDTVLGERGAKLSTGQRQRIAIARAIAKGAPVLILDEPTASLDLETEQILIQRVNEWAVDKVVLLITHRIPLTRQADQVIVLENGTIKEAGSPQELLDNENSRYQALMNESTAI